MCLTICVFHMGIEHSSFSDFSKYRRGTQTPSSSRSLSPLSEEIPHTSYLTGKSIGSTCPVTFKPATIKTSKSVNFPQLKDTKHNDLMKSFPEQITIVSFGNKEKNIENDYYMQKLMDIPLKYPIIHSLPYPFVKNKNKSQLSQLTSSLSQNLRNLSNTFKEHCHSLYMPILVNQGQLKTRIGEISKETNSVLQTYGTANRQLENLGSIFNDNHAFQSLFDVQVYVKIKTDMDRLQNILRELNAKLPPEKRLKDLP